jgi:HEPN domain-containing protein
MTGCTQPPTEEMNEAEEAVTRAENNPDAVNYAGNLVERAKESLALMYEEADAKRYDSAINYANEAIDMAERAITEGSGQAWLKKNEATSVMSSVGSQIAETEERIDKAKAAKLPLDYGSIDNEFDSVQRTFSQARSAMNGGRYQESIFLSNNLRSSLNSINQKLGTTVMEVVRKK